MAKPKLLLVTDSAKIHTGLSEITRNIFHKGLFDLYKDKYDIYQHGWFNFTSVENVPWPIYSTNVTTEANGQQRPDDSDRYGQRSFEAVLAKVQPDIVWAFGDLWCFDHILNSPNRNKFRLVVYYTIDGAPYYGGFVNKDIDSEWGGKLAKADRVVVCSEFGEVVLHDSCPELDGKPIDVIYPPMDVNRFKILDPIQKKKTRVELYNAQVPTDAFIMGWVGRNQFRKQNHKMWEVMHYIKYGDYIECNQCNRVTVKEYNWSKMETRPGTYSIYEDGYDFKTCWYCKSSNITNGKPLTDIYLWQHTPRTDPGYSFNLHSRMWGVDDRMIYTGSVDGARGLTPDTVSKMIATWDVMLYLSGGEGFGVPAMESMMCGIPVIYTNYSSHADFCKYGGLPVRCSFIPELSYGIHRAIADTGNAVQQILWSYRNQDKLAAIGEKGREFGVTKSIPNIAAQWDNLFTEMMKQPIAMQGGKKIYAQII